MFSALTGKEASATLFKIWSQALGDIPPEQLSAAGNKLLKTWHYPNLPLPADVRGPIDAARAEQAKDDAENAWQAIMKHVVKWCHPDGILPFGCTPPRLSPRMDHAARAAGGTRFLWNATDEELVWAKKRFVEDFERSELLADSVALLPMRPKLALVEKPAAKQLPAADTPCSQEDAAFIRSQLETLRRQMVQLSAPAETEITDAMRERAKQAGLEAIRRFSTAAHE